MGLKNTSMNGQLVTVSFGPDHDDTFGITLESGAKKKIKQERLRVVQGTVTAMHINDSKRRQYIRYGEIPPCGHNVVASDPFSGKCVKIRTLHSCQR